MGPAVILFVGPLPPPVHGFSFINAAMLARFQAVAPVAVFNRAPGGGISPRWTRFLLTLWRHRAGASLYIGLSGGWGQLKDWPYLLAARLMRCPVAVHHHSFAYLRRAPWYTRLVLGNTRRAQHLVLCDCMAAALAGGYGIARHRIAVVSNAAFLDAAEGLPLPPPRGAALRLGFLSNITAEKGIWAFFELGDALVSSGVTVQALIAGPPAADIAERFAKETTARPWCSHVGAVYGAEKARFFADIDVLVFPTLYANEAEPVTILEALRSGVPVVANARGCIGDMLPLAAGVVFEGDTQFVRQAAERLRAWALERPAAGQARRVAAREAFAMLQAEHSQRVDAIVAQLAGTTFSVAATGSTAKSRPA